MASIELQRTDTLCSDYRGSDAKGDATRGRYGRFNRVRATKGSYHLCTHTHVLVSIGLSWATQRNQPLLKDTPNEGYHRNYLLIKDT